MNQKLVEFVMFGRRLNRQHVQLVIVLVSLAMLILGVGAPSDGGGAG